RNRAPPHTTLDRSLEDGISVERLSLRSALRSMRRTIGGRRTRRLQSEPAIPPLTLTSNASETGLLPAGSPREGTSFMPTRRFAFVGCLALLLAARALVAQAQLAAEEELKTLRPAEGLDVSLFASEPLISNPAAIDVDTHG